MRACGLVLAAGAGTRFGGPKGLARTADGEPWVARAVRMLRAGGCIDVLVAVGARGGEVAELVPADTVVVPVPDWGQGLSATLRAGLEVATARVCDVLVVSPVDTPDAPPAAVERTLAVAARAGDGSGADALVQAVYRGRPGHPVVIGRAHFAGASAAVAGDRGARAYLVAHGVTDLECGDLWSGADIDAAP